MRLFYGWRFAAALHDQFITLCINLLPDEQVFILDKSHSL